MLTKFYRWLFHSCEHEWKLLDKIQVKCLGNYCADDYILQCKKCGDIKKRRV